MSNVLFLSHGGGPLPLLGDRSHNEMIENLKLIRSIIDTPESIVLISAHWEEDIPVLTGAERPELIYDYHGFPKESYELKYPAPGSPELALRISDLLSKEKIVNRVTNDRGFDHGLFVPLKILYPEANIPCVQLSLVKNLDAKTHIEIGKALSSILPENILIIGSGFSFHNLQAFFNPTNGPDKDNVDFEKWLIDTCSSANLSEQERKNRLINWKKAPGARYCHPREEHLMPLHVCYGITQRPCSEFFELQIMNKKASVYLW